MTDIALNHTFVLKDIEYDYTFAKMDNSMILLSPKHVLCKLLHYELPTY